MNIWSVTLHDIVGKSAAYFCIFFLNLYNFVKPDTPKVNNRLKSIKRRSNTYQFFCSI